jgi:DHA1 family tetracycline resistance protein-like MFS transporter
MTAPAANRKALAIIFVTIMANMIGFGVIMPVMPKLIMDVTGEGLAEAARWGGILSLSYALMQFIMMPVMGALSDALGRRPIILGSLAVFSFDMLLMAIAPTIGLLVAARLISGAFAATFSTANAYIADISPPEKRAANFGLVGAAFGLGFIIGPGIGGYVGDHFGPRAPFFLVAALGLVTLAFGYFLLPETLTKENRRAFDWRRANPIGSALHLRRYPAILPIAAAILFYQLGHFAFPSVWAYYAEARFGWTPTDIGHSLMLVGLSAAVVQGGLSRKAIPFFGERKAAMIGLAIAVIAYAGYGLADKGWMVYALIPFGALGGFTLPALQGIMSRTIPPDAQGELQGAIGAINGVAMMAGPLLMTQIFAYFAEDDAPVLLPGAPFLMAGVMAAISLTLLSSAFARIIRPRDAKSTTGVA